MTEADLNAAASPDEIPAILRRAADAANEAAARLQSDWQDESAGQPWVMIARELNRAADRIEKVLP